MKKTTLYIPEDLAITVADAARRQGTSEAALIREAIAVYVATIERPRPSIIGSVAVEGVRGEDTEEFLLENWQPE
ncbi:MAG: CopG family transcriptional regulator [Thermomicrobiales bacterium]